MSEWQLIDRETGRAGLALLVSWVGGPVEYAEREKFTDRWRSADVKVREFRGSQVFYNPPPTHWCPFPEAPK